jgi:hypothetical protein
LKTFLSKSNASLLRVTSPAQERWLERVLKIARAVLRGENKLLGCTAKQCWGGAAGFVAPQSKIHEGYSPSSSQYKLNAARLAGCLAIRPAALAIPDPIYFQNTLLTGTMQ